MARGSRALSKLNTESFPPTLEAPKSIFKKIFVNCPTGDEMATLGLVEYKDASPEVRAIYDDIMAVRKTDWINNFWKALAHDPATLKRTWEDIKQIMGPGALDPLTKELIYVAVSVSNQCDYCIASHTVSARKKGMTDAMFKELMAVVGMANETNRLSAGYQVEIDPQFKPQV
jgi:AhpD family alkylhydroperoxidase